MATLIGDLVSSRHHVDRLALQRLVTDVLTSANEHLVPQQPLESTVGDEFQGGFATIAAAARASLVLRLELVSRDPSADSRYGLGHGTVTVFDADRTPMSQDGPGWWSARQAIDRARHLAEVPRTAFLRTFLCDGVREGHAAVDVGAVNAFLVCRDAIVDQMNERQRRLLLGLVHGRSQAAMAAEEGVTQGAVSQALRRSGAFAIEAGHALLEATTA